MDIDQVDMLHRIMLAMGPQTKIKINPNLVKSLLIAVAIFSDQETGDELKRLIRQM